MFCFVCNVLPQSMKMIYSNYLDLSCDLQDWTEINASGICLAKCEHLNNSCLSRSVSMEIIRFISDSAPRSLSGGGASPPHTPLNFLGGLRPPKHPQWRLRRVMSVKLAASAANFTSEGLREMSVRTAKNIGVKCERGNYSWGQPIRERTGF